MTTSAPPINGSLTDLLNRLPENASTAFARLLTVVAADERKAPFVARALQALAAVTEAASRPALAQAVGASSDVRALLQAVDQSDVLASVAASDPLADAHLRGLIGRLWLFEAEGGTRPAAEFGRLLGISRQAVDKRRRAGKILALDRGRRGYAYPVWQVSEAAVLPGFASVLAALTGFDPMTQAAFLLNPNTWLDDETPLDEIRRGHLPEVLAAAAVFGEQVAA